jgi:predicted NACHT family NTPase
VLELPNHTNQTLPSEKPMGDIFNEVGRALLILGEPGSGKTTTLLQLAHDLIARAKNDPGQPVPVVLNLSTWTDRGQLLINWLVEELADKYYVPKRMGRAWLERNRLILLLDGLDEVRPDSRAACVEAITRFGEDYGIAGLVVCSRLREYTALPTRLKLNGAICLQSLTLAQV